MRLIVILSLLLMTGTATAQQSGCMGSNCGASWRLPPEVMSQIEVAVSNLRSRCMDIARSEKPLPKECKG
jgi:hypothetical protein